MHKTSVSFSKALFTLAASLCLSSTSLLAQVAIPGSAAAGPPASGPGGSLNGEYWHRPPNSILTDGAANPANRIDVQISGFGAPDGTFTSTLHNYVGNDLTPVLTWLGADAASFVGTPNNLDDAALRFRGFINVAAPGDITLGTTSDDGSRITIAGIDVIANDGSHGDVTVDAVASFAAAGLYPIEVTFFAGDWTDDGACPNPPVPNHHPNCPASGHGGDNYHLRVGGAFVDATTAGIFHATLPPRVIQTTVFDPAGRTWSYNDATLSPGLTGAWTTPGYDTSSEPGWKTGTSLFGNDGTGIYDTASQPFAGRGINGFETELDRSNGRITFYFRTKFNWTGSPVGVSLISSNWIDDGIVAYLNGVEVSRIRLPAGAITWDTLGANPTEGLVEVQTWDASSLVEGENTIAVELHQSGAGSTDAAMAIGLYAQLPLPPTIINANQPTNRSVFANRDTTLIVEAIGSPAPTFLWYHDGAPMDTMANPSAATATLNIVNMQATDGGNYFCRVANVLGSVDSRTATVTYVNDITPPVMVSAGGSATFDRISIGFDGAVKTGGVEPASDVFTYEITGGALAGANPVAVFNSPDGRSVVLVLDAGTPLAPDTDYTVRVVGDIQDLAGNSIVPNSEISFRSWVMGGGCIGVVFEAYNTGGGNAVANLTGHASYPNSPDFRTVLPAIDIRVATVPGPGDPSNPGFYNSDAREAYGGRLRGHFIASESGPHTFFFAADDNGEFWLSTDQDPANKVLVARETSWSSTKEWTVSGGSSTLSAKRGVANLVAGRAYYFEALYKEGTGGDNCAVAVKPPSQATDPVNGADAVGASYLGAAAPANVLGPLTITQQPADLSLVANTIATFSVGLSVPSYVTVCYQWRRDGVDIPGANGSSYSFGPVSAADDNATFDVAVAIIGASAVSSTATLRVGADTVAPVVLSVEAGSTSSNIVVRFSERLNTLSAEDAFAYTLLPEGTVTTALALLQADGSNVVLTIEANLEAGRNYTLRIENVTDLSGNVINPNPTEKSFSISSLGGYAAAIAADNPIAWYRFNDAPPTAINSGSLGAAANGTYNGGATSGSEAPKAPGFPGLEAGNTALQCNGTDAFVGTVAGLMNSRPVFTVTGWMRRNGDQAGRTGLWGQNDLLEFGYIANQTLEVWTDNGLDVANAIPNGEWAHLAFVSTGNPGNMLLYTNGVLAGQRAHSLPADNTFAFNIGGGGVFDATGNFFNGQIDEVAIFASELSATKIKAQYDSARVEPGYSFTDCATPPGTALTGVARIGNDGLGGANCFLHLTDAGQFSIYGTFNIADKYNGAKVNEMKVRWRSYIGDGGAGGADGYSFNWGTDLANDTVGEEGTGTGLSVTVDTFDNGGGETGIELKWGPPNHGSAVGAGRVAFTPIPKDNPGNGIYLRKGQFVNAELTVTASGLATFAYDGQVVSAQLPGYNGMVGARFQFGARTGNANDNHWIDDIIIQATPVPGPAITQHPASQTVSHGQTATFSVAANGTPPLSYQWHRKLASDAGFSPIAGANGATYTTPPVSYPADDQSQFKVVVSNADGSSESSAATVTVPLFIPAASAAGPPRGFPGGLLLGEYWKRPPLSIFTDGNTVPAHRVDTQIAGFGPASGTFRASTFVYLGNDLTPVLDWLGSTDGASFSGTPENLDDGAFRFTGFINITAPGILSIGTTSDDGSRLKIGGLDVIENDGGHGDITVDRNISFLAAGLYPIEITYFNGDWTDPANPASHGGANFHLRMGGADITPFGVAMLHPPGDPLRVAGASAKCEPDKITVRYNRAVQLDGTYSYNLGFVTSVAYGADQSEVVLTTDPLPPNSAIVLTITGVHDLGGAGLDPDPTVVNLTYGFGGIGANFDDGQVPAGTIASGSTAPYVGPEGALHLTDLGVLSQQNFWTIPIGSTITLDRLQASWRTRFEGLGQADGISFNVGEAATPGAPFTYVAGIAEEGATVGLSVTVDTFNNAEFNPGSSDVGTEVRWNGVRLSYTPAGSGTTHGPAELMTGTFVDTSVEVSPSGFVTFKHGPFTTSAQIPNFTGIRVNQYEFAARTGGAAEAAWIDDVHINDFALSAPTIGGGPNDLTVPEGTTASFAVTGVNGIIPISYQWLRDGAPIPGANGPTYSLTAVSADSGAKFSVRLANDCGVATSREATLTVVVAPVVLRSSSRGNCHAVYVTYNKAVLLDGTYSVICSNGTAVVLLTQDFNANDGGFTVDTPVAFDGPWVYNAGAGRWDAAGQGPENSRPNTTILTSPSFNVSQSGLVQLSLVHSYSFEGGNWDGGQVRVSVNGGPFNAVPASAFSQNGYSGNVLPNSASELKGQGAFVNNSPGSPALITSVCALGMLQAGDTVRVQFYISSDTNTQGPNQPQWGIDSLSVSSFAVSSINVASVAHAESQSVVRLNLATDLVPDVNVYRVLITGVHDTSGVVIEPNPTITSFVHGGSEYPLFSILERRYNGIGGVRVADFTSHPKFPNNPDLVLRNPTAFFEVPPNVANDYGVQLLGWAMAPIEADYRFWVSADDGAELWIAEDGVPANKHKIAIEPEWAGSRQYTAARACCGDPSIPGGNRGTPPANGSASIHLQAGQVVYLEGLMKEGGGGDNFSVAVTLNDPNPPANDSAPISIQYFQPRRLGPNGEIFTRLCDVFCYSGPSDQTVFLGDSATFSFVPDGTPPWTIQWRKNGADIPGANGTSYTTPPTTAADDGAVYSVALGNAFSSTTCSATLHVRPDPRVVDVFARCEASAIHVLFNKPVRLDGTYTLSSGFVNGQSYGASHAEVILSVDPLAAESVSTVTIADVHSEDGFVIIPNPTTRSLSYGVGRFCVDFNDGQLPAGTIASGTTPPYVGAEGALHITDRVNSQANFWTIPLGGVRNFSSFNARWRTLIEGVGGADGVSFNVGQNLGTGFTPEDGAANGLSVQIDTYNNGANDAGVEIKWNGGRIGFLPVGAGVDGSGAPPELAIGAFVDTSVDVSASGAVTFKYATYTVTGQIPGFSGINANMYVFAARTGGANENAWIDDLCIQPFVPGPASIVQQPADASIAQECVGTATFSATINGTPPFSGEWHSNGVVVASFTGSASTVQSYTTPPLCRSADGARYQLVLRNQCGSVASREAIVTIECDATDTTPPVIVCPPNLTVDASGQCAIVTYAPTASDDCHLRTVICVPPSGSCLPVGTTTVTCTATDGANHASSCSFTVTVRSGCQPPTAVIVSESLVEIPGFDHPVLISCNWWNACLIADGWTSDTTPPGGTLSYLWFLEPDPVPFGSGPVITNCLEVGEHTITLLVTDTSCGSTDTDSKTIEVVTAPLAIELLIEEINSGSLKSAIPRKTKRELTATLRVALEFSKDNKLRETQKAMDAFEKKVRAQVSPNYPVEATKWIRWSQAVTEGMEKCIKPPRKKDDDDDKKHPRK